MKTQKFGFIILLLAIILSCGDVENDDSLEELPCNDLTGTWLVTQTYCDGLEIGRPYQTFTFDNPEQITSLFGGSDCQRSFQSTATHTIPILSMVGTGNFTCQANGADVASCGGTDTSCDAGTSAENRTNSFQICVLRNKSNILLSRTVSTEDVSSQVTGCSEVGQVEELILELPVENLARLAISDGATYDFGSTTIGMPVYKQFIVTNSGTAPATAVATSSLPSPFVYAGGAFPGTDGDQLIGDCDTEIQPGSCKLTIAFNPESPGDYNGTLTLSYNNGVQITDTRRALSGSGI